MLAAGIALVTRQSIAGIFPIHLHHLPVAGHLGDDGGSADGGHALVTLHHRLGGTRQLGAAIAIDQCQLRQRVERLNRALHGQKAGLQNVDEVDFLDLRARNAPGQRPFPDEFRQLLAALLTEQLGIGQPLDGPLGIEDHRRRHHRAGQGATSHFVDTGNQQGVGGQFKVEIHCHRLIPYEPRPVPALLRPRYGWHPAATGDEYR